jgi:hypothetical protein
MIFVEKKFKQNFGGLRQELSIKSDEFTPSPEFLKFSELAPLARGTLVIPDYNTIRLEKY